MRGFPFLQAPSRYKTSAVAELSCALLESRLCRADLHRGSKDLNTGVLGQTTIAITVLGTF